MVLAYGEEFVPDPSDGSACLRFVARAAAVAAICFKTVVKGASNASPSRIRAVSDFFARLPMYLRKKCFGSNPDDTHKKPIDEHHRGVDTTACFTARWARSAHTTLEWDRMFQSPNSGNQSACERRHCRFRGSCHYMWAMDASGRSCIDSQRRNAVGTRQHNRTLWLPSNNR